MAGYWIHFADGRSIFLPIEVVLFGGAIVIVIALAITGVLQEFVQGFSRVFFPHRPVETFDVDHQDYDLEAERYRAMARMLEAKAEYEAAAVRAALKLDEANELEEIRNHERTKRRIEKGLR